MLFLVLTMFVTTSSVYRLQSKQGLPLVNQILGWVVLGERLLRCHKPAFHLHIDDSLRLVVPIRVPRHVPKLAFEDPLILPRFLRLLRDTFYQRRRAVFPLVFGFVGCMG